MRDDDFAQDPPELLVSPDGPADITFRWLTAVNENQDEPAWELMHRSYREKVLDACVENGVDADPEHALWGLRQYYGGLQLDDWNLYSSKADGESAEVTLIHAPPGMVEEETELAFLAFHVMHTDEGWRVWGRLVGFDHLDHVVPGKSSDGPHQGGV